MIEINLSPTKNGGDKLNVGGFDLSHINVKMVLLGVLFLYIPEGLLSSYYEDEISSLTKKEQTLRSEVRKTSSKVRSLNNIKKQVEALKKQEDALSERLKTVKLIINKRKNPFKVLYYVAENTPKTVWLTSIKMEDTKLILSGHAENWKDIGVFLESLKNSIFLANIQYKVPDGVKNEYGGRKVEVFQITSDITRFK